MPLSKRDIRTEEVADEAESCRIHIDYEEFEWVFSIQHLSIRRSDVNSQVTVDWQTSGAKARHEFGIPIRPLPPQNLNWRSVTGLDAFTRRLRRYYSDVMPWEQFVEWTAGEVDKYIRRPVSFEEPEWRSDPTTSYLLRPLIPSSGTTIFFGPGDSGKGYLILALMYALCYNAQGQFDTWPDKRQGPIYYLDYEDSREEWSNRLTRLAQGFGVQLPPNLKRISGRGIPLAEQSDSLIAQMNGSKPRLLVIDSAVPACGGDPNEAETVRAFFSALARFKCPVALIAHETKAENDFYPFGSIFWHNLARWTVNIRGALHLSGENHLLLRHRKHNSGPRFSNRALRLRFSDDDRGELPAWTMMEVMGLSQLTDELQEKRSLAERLADYQEPEEGIDLDELAEEMGVKRDTLKKSLQRRGYKGPGIGKKGRWQRK